MTLKIGTTSDGRDALLPLDAVTQTFALLGMRGVGKTTGAVVLVEEMVRAGLPVVIVDPTGVWWGIRSSADGTAAGLPVVIFGGDHADVPLDEGGGALLAEFLVAARLPALLDLSRFRKNAQRRFMTDFAETLYHLNRAPLHVVLDECDLFAPQRVPAGAERLLGAIDDLARRGRARGIGLTLISQRPAVVNKDALTQTGTLFALRLTAPQDRAAIDDWICAHGTDEQRRELLGSLAGLPVGTAWLSSPGWLRRFDRVAIRQRTTFDSSRTPEMGETLCAPRALATIDLDAVRAQMAALAAPANPKAPRAGKGKDRGTATAASAVGTPSDARVAELERKLIERDEDITRLENRLATVHGIALRAAEMLRAVPDTLRDAARACEDVMARLDMASGPHTTGGGACVVGGPLAHHAVAYGVLQPDQPSHAITARPPPEAAPSPARPRAPQAPKMSGERRVLVALAQHHPSAVTRQRLALLTDYTASGGSFLALLASLRRQGFTDTPTGDGIRLTSAGMREVGDFEPLPTGRALADHWIGRLNRMEGRILQLLVQTPGLHTRAAVAQRLGYAAAGGSFLAAVKKLRTLCLVSASGKSSIRASDDLLGEGA